MSLFLVSATDRNLDNGLHHASFNIASQILRNLDLIHSDLRPIVLRYLITWSNMEGAV